MNIEFVIFTYVLSGIVLFFLWKESICSAIWRVHVKNNYNYKYLTLTKFLFFAVWVLFWVLLTLKVLNYKKLD